MLNMYLYIIRVNVYSQMCIYTLCIPYYIYTQIPMNVTQGSLKVSNPQMFENATFQCYNTLNDIIISQKLTTTTHQEGLFTFLHYKYIYVSRSNFGVTRECIYSKYTSAKDYLYNDRRDIFGS